MAFPDLMFTHDRKQIILVYKIQENAIIFAYFKEIFILVISEKGNGYLDILQQRVVQMLNFLYKT